MKQKCVVCKSSKGKLIDGAHALCAYRIAGIEKGERQYLKSRSPKPNPSGMQKLGDIVEIRYKRTTGAKPGFYKHTFKKGAGVIVVGKDREGRKVIVVKPK